MTCSTAAAHLRLQFAPQQEEALLEQEQEASLEQEALAGRRVLVLAGLVTQLPVKSTDQNLCDMVSCTHRCGLDRGRILLNNLRGRILLNNLRFLGLLAADQNGSNQGRERGQH